MNFKTKGRARGFGTPPASSDWESTKAMMGEFEPLQANIPSATLRQLEAIAEASEATMDEMVTTLLVQGLVRIAKKLEAYRP